MRFSINVLLAGAGLISSVFSTTVLAEPYGMLNGRLADMSRMPERSVEAGAVFGEISLGGDFDDLDYEHFGGRFNFKLNPTTVLYGDLGQTEIEDLDGLTFGIGGFFQVEGILTNNDFAVHASFHKVELDDDRFELDVNAIIIEALISGNASASADQNTGWYGSVGLNRTSGDGESETELTFGGGIVMPNASNSGEFYGGVLYTGELAFGAGYRFYLN